MRERRRYRLITTLLDHHRHPALEIVALYHQRWRSETALLELKSTTLGGRLLRARTPDGIDQEVHALLTAYQALRLAMADATMNHPTISPDRAGFTITLQTARDQIVRAAGVIAATTVDLVGRIGRAVLADPLPPRRSRVGPPVVKRAIFKHRAKRDIDRTNHQATSNIVATGLTTDP
nr:transposase [Saccharothrix sp. ALI-22-I]